MSEFEQIESSQRQHYEMLEHETRHGVAIQSFEYNLIRMLKPKVSIDGNQWSLVYGENLQDGVAGFGDSFHLAVLDFNKSVHRKLQGSNKE